MIGSAASRLPAEKGSDQLSQADRALLDAFLQGTLPAAEFSHEAHVRVAWALLETMPVPDALTVFSRSLRALADRYGKPDLYHETITWAFLLWIQERLARFPNAAWPEFARANQDLLTWPSPLLQRYYSAERLWSEEARRGFLWPDKCDSPTEPEADRRPSQVRSAATAGRMADEG